MRWVRCGDAASGGRLLRILFVRVGAMSLDAGRFRSRLRRGRTILASSDGVRYLARLTPRRARFAVSRSAAHRDPQKCSGVPIERAVGVIRGCRAFQESLKSQ